MKTWICVNCGSVCEEAAGHPASGIALGTVWVDVPDDWVCPDCVADKALFEMLEI